MSESRSIKREILSLLSNEHPRCTPIHLERVITQRVPMTTRRVFRSVLKDLLTTGHLTYTQHFSTTHIEINYQRPFKVSDRFVLSPANFSRDADEKEIVIQLNDGSSFGAGDHPTTRMMLRGMDYVIQPKSVWGAEGIRRALDIGTGSGVLAIAAGALGVERVEGVDIDLMACHEANKNVKLNDLNDVVNISSGPLDIYYGQPFDLLLANLRPPTIRKLIPLMLEVTSSKAVWIISGCRKDEKERILKLLPKDLSNVIWQENCNNWSAFAVKRNPGLK